jgi:ferredoxin
MVPTETVFSTYAVGGSWIRVCAGAMRRPASGVFVRRALRTRSQQTAAVCDRPGSFDGICKRSGITVTVPAEKSVYDALADAGVEVDSSCLEGTCGTCETKVLEGRPDHRDSLLTEPEHEKARAMYVCVSRARSEQLVLDLNVTHVRNN